MNPAGVRANFRANLRVDGQIDGLADVLVIGGGIAGASAAYFAARRGRTVTVCDVGRDCASRVPTALINPVRGYRARISREDLEGARITFELIEALRASGHSIRAGRGLYRPVPDDQHEAEWRAQLPATLAHEWLGPEALSALVGNWHRVLFLPEAGWVETEGFLSALLEESRASVVTDEVVAVDPGLPGVVLASGQHMRARSLVWCGGALGAALLGWPARFRPGSVATLAEPWSGPPVSFGLYFAPSGSGSVAGPTTEGEFKDYGAAMAPATAAEEELLARVHTARGTATLSGLWRGVRLDTVTAPSGLSLLGPFGSRGYLRAPAAARHWAQSLS